MKKTVIYTITGIISPLLMLVLLPVYLKFLSPTEYIVIALTNSFLAIFAIFFNLKTEQAYRTIYFYETKNKPKQLALFQTVFSFNVLCSLVWFGLFLLFGKVIFSELFKNDISFFPYSYLIFISFLIGNLNNLYFIYLQNNSKVKSYSFLVLFLALATHGLQLSCVFIFKTTFFWFVSSALIANGFLFLYLFLSNRTLFSFSISKTILNEAIHFSWPFLPFLVLYSIESQMDRFFIERFSTISELARYVVLTSIVGAVYTFFNSIDNAIRPEIYLYLGEKKNAFQNKIQEQFDFYLLIGLVSFSFLIAFGIHIDWFLQNEKYVGTSTYFIPMALAFFPLIASRFLALQLLYDQKIAKLNGFILIKILLMAGLFYLFIPKLGINGAILAIGISNVFNLLFFYGIDERKIIPSKKVLRFIFGFLTLNLFLLFNQETKFVSLIAIGQCLFFGIVFLLFYRKKLTV
jgi:O-antigen/teichoic acid export membrane protein